MSLDDDIKAAVALGTPLIELGLQLYKNQVSKRDAALAAAKLALSAIPLAELIPLLTQADKDAILLAADTAASFEFGFPDGKGGP